jgi:hypothetical protein
VVLFGFFLGGPSNPPPGSSLIDGFLAKTGLDLTLFGNPRH